MTILAECEIIVVMTGDVAPPDLELGKIGKARRTRGYLDSIPQGMVDFYGRMPCDASKSLAGL
jgi:hypothetical protein